MPLSSITSFKFKVGWKLNPVKSLFYRQYVSWVAIYFLFHQITRDIMSGHSTFSESKTNGCTQTLIPLL